MPRVYPPRRVHIGGYREDPDVAAELDRLAAERGVDRVVLIREATRAYVERARTADGDTSGTATTTA